MIQPFNEQDILPKKSSNKVASVYHGRFQPFHIGHSFIEYHLPPNCQIAMITGKKIDSMNPFTPELRLQMIKSVAPQREVFQLDSGWIGDIVQHFRENNLELTKLFCGPDRLAHYTDCVQRFNDLLPDNKKCKIKIMQLQRTAHAKYIRYLIQTDQFEQFKSVMPTELWQYWTELKDQIKVWKYAFA